ncbi:hypothetical protein AAG570_013942 [Ranatra chinensis]|uniref:Palmitoyl-protein thioesterase 1 n=1 Tax=Ranatra chinensis TaxID=642074 RepID=A0ABD0YDN7_9HEMI
MDLIKETAPGMYVKSLQIGNNFIEDTTNGFFMNANDQVKMACDLISSDPQLKDGYNAMGFSQGGQFLRAVAQRCPVPKMLNLISFGGQHQGVYGLPHCFYPQHKWCNYLRILLNRGAYWSWVQKQFVQAEYWHDPLDEEKYRQNSIFLADINNERYLNTSYRENLYALSNLVLVKFEGDSMVQPSESEWFGFYTPGQAVNITNLEDSKIYTEDLLGLQAMDKEQRLKFLSVPGDHLEFTDDWFIEKIVKVYLM